MPGNDRHCLATVGVSSMGDWDPLAKAHALPGISRTGVEQQLGGELDASRSSRSEELDSHRKLAGGTEDRSDSFGGGELP